MRSINRWLGGAYKVNWIVVHREGKSRRMRNNITIIIIFCITSDCIICRDLGPDKVIFNFDIVNHLPLTNNCNTQRLAAMDVPIDRINSIKARNLLTTRNENFLWKARHEDDDEKLSYILRQQTKGDRELMMIMTKQIFQVELQVALLLHLLHEKFPVTDMKQRKMKNIACWPPPPHNRQANECSSEAEVGVWNAIFCLFLLFSILCKSRCSAVVLFSKMIIRGLLFANTLVIHC